ncbi:MAG: hypothetical protein ABI813_02650, partial [Bacteroidota bacterium]
MKYLVVSCILFLYTLQTFGQQEYFVYLQTDNNQPFYVRINNRVYSSSLTGYLILSKLADSAHSVTIGFPKNVFPEQQFNIPVKHKDAGYLLKSFGDRGWGLFNLQSLSVIMNDNPPGEKKNPELTGTRKTDAFSMLLANAVNDTAVLYTATRPPKPAPVEVREEAKKDSALLAKTATPKDSSPSTRPVKNDSNIADSNNPAAANDILRVATAQPAAMKAQPAPDTVLVSKNTSRPAAHPTGKNKPVKKEPPITARNDASAQRKATIMVIGRRAREKAVAKDKNERKDTIIMMSGGPTEKSVAKNTRAAKKKSPAHDTLRIKKEIIFAPEEKRNALLNNRDAVVIENVPLKKETDTHHEPRKDTIELLTGKETAPETKRDTFTAAPAKRLRPLVNKAAELLTDTSYIAVFVDESNEKFDTIRISIPFNEQSMMVRREPKLAPADTAATVSNPSPPPVISQAPPVL